MPEPEQKSQRVPVDQLARWLKEWEFYEEYWALLQILYTAASPPPTPSSEMNSVMLLEQDRIVLRSERMCLDREEALDVSQEYCLKLCTSRKMYDPKQPVKRWFNQIFNNVITDYWRKRSRRARFILTDFQSPNQDNSH